jgi:hypothetical protein
MAGGWLPGWPRDRREPEVIVGPTQGRHVADTPPFPPESFMLSFVIPFVDEAPTLGELFERIAAAVRPLG